MVVLNAYGEDVSTSLPQDQSGDQTAGDQGDEPTDEQPEALRAPDGRSHRWNEHREQRRAAIVAAGVQCVEDHGIDVEVFQIARAAHVSRTVLYRYFRDKDDLTQAMAAYLAQQIIEMIEQALEAEDLPSRMIGATVAAIAEWVDEHPLLYQYLRARSTGGNAALENVEASVADNLAALLNAILSYLGADPLVSQIAAHAIVGMVENTLTWWVIDRPVSRDELCRALDGFITDAIIGYLRRNDIALDLDAPLPLMARPHDEADESE